MGFSQVLEQVGRLEIVMLIGFLAGKVGYIKPEVKEAISKLITRILLPFLIVSSIFSKELDSKLLLELGQVLFMSLFVIALRMLFPHLRLPAPVQKAIEGVGLFVTTLFSLVTIPLICRILL